MIATVAEETSSPAVIAPGVVASSPRATATMNPTHDNPSKNENSIPRTHTVDVEDAPSNQVNSLDKTENNNGSSYLYLGFLLLTKFWLVTTIWIYKYLLQLADVMTFVVGYLTKLVPVDDISKWISETIPPWLEVILFQSSSPHNALKGSNSDHAWPPPALKALALLTIVALVIHPDGLTWVFLGKLRDTIYAFFSALGNSLEFLLNDYGVFPTIIAATTLAAMFFLVFVVIRTLSPKGKKNSDKHNNTLHNERKKKKKKGGNARHRNNHHNHRSNNNNHSRIKSTRRSRSQDVVNGKVENDSITEAIPCSPIPSPPPTEVPENDSLSLSPSLPLEKALDSPSEAPSATILDNKTAESNQEAFKDGASEKAQASIGLKKSSSKDNHLNKARRRVASASTADTTPLSDDQSCGSMSVRSFPSVSVNSNRSGGKKTKHSTPRRLKRHGTVKSPKKSNSNMNNHAASVESPGTSSRWDALKPTNGNAGKSNNHKNNTHGGHHNHSNGTQGGNKKQNQRHRANNSRRPANGRKGRHHPKSFAPNEEPSVASEPVRAHQGRATSGVSPTRSTMRQDSKVPDNPFASQSAPIAPPGFQNSSNYDFETKPSLFGTPLEVHSTQNGNNNIAGVSPKFFQSAAPRSSSSIQENPFRSDVPAISGSYGYQQQHRDSQIEADLQELGGQMAGSILDF